MSAFSFQSTRSIIAEPGAAGQTGALAASLGCRSVLVVSDHGVRSLGLLDRALDSLAAAGLSVSVFAGVVADPPVGLVLDAVAQAKSEGIDGVIGIGGGSPMDVAKLVALLASSGETIDAIYGVGLARGPRLPLILAPTTAGTGSEVTPIAIVTTGEGEKKGIVSPLLLPDVALLDATLTLSCPRAVTAATGIDAMVHAIEAITSRRLKNPISDCLAKEALRLISRNIRTACETGDDLAARQAMLTGSMLAGMAFANAPVAAVHALAYPVGARFHVPHGLSNALVLPHVLRFNLDAARAHYDEIAEIVLGDGADAAALIGWLAALPAGLGLPTRLSEVGIGAGDLDALASDAMRQTRLLINNPREMTLASAGAIYTAAL